jgi:hypothetical protein
LIRNDSGEHGLLGGDEIDKILGKQENDAVIIYINLSDLVEGISVKLIGSGIRCRRQ